MSNLRKSLIVIPALLFILACQAVTRPVQQAQDAAGTAAAFATQAGEIVTQVSGLATEAAPFETFMPDGSAVPEIPGNIFDPQSPPLSEWQGIPVMPQALAGEETDDMYVYKVAVTVTEVDEFYAAQLPSLGWEKIFSMPATEGMTILLYGKDGQSLSVTVTTQEGFVLVMLTLS